MNHRDSLGRYILRIPEQRSLHDVVEITDRALLDYADKVDEFFAELSPQYSHLTNRSQLEISGIAISKNIERLGQEIILGGENFVAFVSRVKGETNYIPEEEWISGGDALVYYGDGVTWTLSADQSIYQIMLSGTDISLDLDSLEGLEYDPETGYYITYSGQEFLPKPVIRFDESNENTVRVGNAKLPKYDLVNTYGQGEYQAKIGRAHV